MYTFKIIASGILMDENADKFIDIGGCTKTLSLMFDTCERYSVFAASF